MNDNNRTILFFPFFFLAFLFCLFPSRLVYYNYVAVCLCLACVEFLFFPEESLVSVLDGPSSLGNEYSCCCRLACCSYFLHAARVPMFPWVLVSVDFFFRIWFNFDCACCYVDCVYVFGKKSKKATCVFVCLLASWLAGC